MKITSLITARSASPSSCSMRVEVGLRAGRRKIFWQAQVRAQPFFAAAVRQIDVQPDKPHRPCRCAGALATGWLAAPPRRYLAEKQNHTARRPDLRHILRNFLHLTCSGLRHPAASLPAGYDKTSCLLCEFLTRRSVWAQHFARPCAPMPCLSVGNPRRVCLSPRCALFFARGVAW